MRPLRPIALGSVLALLLALGYAAPVAAAAPANDDLANATAIDGFPFFDQIDATDATLESGETGRCDAGGAVDASAWYRVTLPDGRITVAVGDVMGAVNAAVYGPFSAAPGDIAGLGDPVWCVNGTGGDHALGEFVTPGTYLIQLTTIVDQDPTPWIWVDFMYPPQLTVRSATLVAKGAAVDVTFDMVCRSYYDRDELEVEYGYDSVVQRIAARSIARGQTDFWGWILCDGSRQTLTYRVTTDTLAFKKGVALVEGYVSLEGWGVVRDSFSLKLR